MLFRLVVVCCVLLLPATANARSISLNSCVVNIGRFCPVETIGFTVAAVALLFFSGIPMRWMIRRHVSAQLESNPHYEIGGPLKFLYRHAGYLSFAAVFLAAIALFA